MIKTVKRTVSVIVAAIIAVMVCVIPVSADNATIKCQGSAFVGDTFTVTVTCSSDSASGVGSIDGLLKFNSSNFQCVSNPANTSYSAADKGYIIAFATSNPANANKSETFTFKFKALKEIKDSFVIDAEITSADLSKTNKKENMATVTVTDKTKLSGNANLKKLITSSGALSPKFSPNVTNYTVKVPYSVAAVYISAVTEVDAAGITVDGGSAVKVGNNVRKITVNAPNGNKKIYTLTIYRAKDGEDINSTSSNTSSEATSSEITPAGNPLEIKVDNEQKFIASDFSSVVIPAGFKETVLTVNDAEVPAIIDPINNKTLVYATDKDGNNGHFYIYDREKNSFSLYRYFNTKAARYVILDCDSSKSVPEGYYYATTEIEGYSCGCFKYSDQNFSSFYIFYCETEDGTVDYYRYDKTDGSMQRAKEFSLLMKENEGQTKKESLSILQKFTKLDLKGKIIVITVLVIVLLIIALLIITIIRTIKAKRALRLPPEPLEEDTNFLAGVEDTRELYLGGDDYGMTPEDEDDDDDDDDE